MLYLIKDETCAWNSSIMVLAGVFKLMAFPVHFGSILCWIPVHVTLAECPQRNESMGASLLQHNPSVSVLEIPPSSMRPRARGKLLSTPT